MYYLLSTQLKSTQALKGEMYKPGGDPTGISLTEGSVSCVWTESVP